MFLAYFAPEVALPMATALSAVVGFLFLVGTAPFRLASRAYRKLLRRGPEPAPSTAEAVETSKT